MVDDEKHKTSSKRDRKDYMRDYMRERRKKARQPTPPPPELHGPLVPPNLPRTDSPKAILKAHHDHILALWSETGKKLARLEELARLKGVDEMQLVIDSLMLENKNLHEKVKNLQEASKTCQV